jgi:hypothetical protein
VAEDDVSALFGNIDDLLKLNSDLLEELEKCPYNPTTIAEAFVTRASDFSVYSAYCTNYPRAVAILTLWQHTPQITENSPKVTQFLKLCQKRLHHALPLGAFLIKPVQRILKYHLLFRVSSFNHLSPLLSSPLSTCLPVFIQLCVTIGRYFAGASKVL